MKSMKRIYRTLRQITVALVIIVATGFVTAQDAGAPFKTNSFSNNVAGAPDGTLRITNDGANGGIQPGGDLCAMVYIFAAAQEQTSCCGCLVTPDGLQTADIKTNLTSNPLTGRVPTDGVIQIITALPNSTASPTASVDNSPLCDPTNSFFAGITGATGATLPVIPFPDLRSWTTHIQNKGTGATATSYGVTETENSPALLNPREYAALTAECYFSVVLLGSGQGICDCGAFEQ
jgi:hypothetical protein